MNEIDYIKLIGQGIGIIAFLISCQKYFKRKKKNIIGISIVAHCIYVVHYFMIGAIAGSYAVVISIIRDGYMYLREKHHKKHRSRKIYNNALAFIVIFMLYAFSIAANFSSIKNTLPLFSGVIYFIVEWFTSNKTTLKITAGSTNLLWIIYDIINLSIAGLLADISSLIACVIGVSKDKKRRRRVVKHNH